MNIKQLLTSTVTDQLTAGISEKIGVSGSKSKNVIDLAVPLLMKGLAKNSRDTAEAENISQALSEDHDGSILSKISSSLKDENTQIDGMKILEHILGNKQSTATQIIGSKTGLDSVQVQQILALVAPFVMGALGKEQRDENLGVTDLSSALQSISKQNEESSPDTSNILSQILDQNNNGSIFDEIIRFIKRLFNS